jgi:peptidoglycan/LPS O-acetylase OafA/YrhL
VVPEQPARPRLGGLDALKGIAIVLVVAIHAAPGEGSAYYQYAIAGVARLAVPLFLMISGFLIGTGQPPREKLVGYFWKFVRLHLLYSAFYWATEPWGVGAWRELTLKNALMHFAPFSFPGQFYLFVLPQIWFVFAFLVPSRLRSTTGLLLASLAIAAATIAFVASCMSSGRSPLPWWALGHASATLLGWLYPFTLGIWVGARAAAGPFARLGGPACGLLAAAAAAIVAFDLPVTDGPYYLRHFGYLRWSLLIGMTLLALALPWLARNLRLPPFEALGRESFGVYVFNPLVLGLLILGFGVVTDVPRSLAYGAVMIAVSFVVSRPLRRRIPFAFP